MENRFDKVAKEWDTRPGRMVMAEKFADEIKQKIKGKNYKKVLEYGCGTGNVSFLLKDYFEKVTMADSSQGMIDEVLKKIKQSHINHFYPVLIDLEKNYMDEKFDVIFTLMTLHHVKDIEKVIHEFSKMLLPQGILIIGDLEKEDGNFHRYPENQEVHFGFEKEFLSQVLTNNNLKMESYHVFHELERRHTGVSKIYSLFLIDSILDDSDEKDGDFMELYNNEEKHIMKTAKDALNPKIDRINEIITYAKKANIKTIGIANCISFNKEAGLLVKQLMDQGFNVEKVHCKYGKMPLNDIVEGYKGISCNPAGQAQYLMQRGTELNIMMGLCLGHDMIFNAKSKAPVTPLVVKDRKENHNTIHLLSDKKG